jgi:fumarate hydratase subunit beta
LNAFSLHTDNLKNTLQPLCAGDRVLLSGTVFTARDAAHKRLFEILDSGFTPPFDIQNCVIYYAGPTPAKNGMPIGSCGPTTSSRMDAFSPRLLRLGMCAMIGKGDLSEPVVQAIKENRAVYFCAVGGAGALLAKHITAAREIAFPELGCESIKRMTVSDLPLFVGTDSRGNSIFDRHETR